MRFEGKATTTGTLVALVAIAALLAGPIAVNGAVLESRTPAREAPSVRAVAAAVAAVARELVGKDRMDLDVATCHPLASVMLVPHDALALHMDDQPILPLRTIGERLLDLPPPVC